MNLAHAADLAYAASSPPGSAGGPAAFVQPLILFGAMFAIFYFIVLRPQQRQKAERERMLTALKKGDRVVTNSGIHGTVVNLGEHTVTLRVADQVKLEFDRAAIGSVVAVVLAMSLWYLYPPRNSINLGLDLQGGIHLVLGVDVDKYVASQTERAAEDLKSGLERKGVAVKRVIREGLSTIVVELANATNWNDALTVAAEFSAFEVAQRDDKGGRFTLAMRERQITQLRDDAVRQGLETIRNRIDQFGVAEATIARQGVDRILIQLPGVQDPDRAKALIGKTALLEFKLLDEQTPVEQALAGRLPETSEVVYQRRVDKETKAERKIPYVVQKRTLLTGSELTRAE